jgi:hypothetical protein
MVLEVKVFDKFNILEVYKSIANITFVLSILEGLLITVKSMGR